MTRLGYLVLAICITFSFAMGFGMSSYIKPAMPEFPNIEVLLVDTEYGEVACVTPENAELIMLYGVMLGEAYQ